MISIDGAPCETDIFSEHLGNDASKGVVTDLVIKDSKQIDVKVEPDKLSPCVTGSVFLTSGELILCDYNNDKIKLLNTDFTVKDFIKVPGAPWDISLTSDTEAVATMPGKKILQFVQILPRLQLLNTFHFDYYFRGVSVHNGYIYVSFRHGEIRVIDLYGNTLKSIGQIQNGHFRFKHPEYIATSNAGKLYVSECLSSGAISCLSLTGRTLYRYEKMELKKAQGIYVDDEDNVLVCGYESNNIHVLDTTGRRIKMLLTEKDGLQFPHCICFRPSDGTLVVGGSALQKLLVFQTEQVLSEPACESNIVRLETSHE